MYAACEILRTPVSTRFSVSVANEKAGAGRDGRTRLARSKSPTRTRTGKINANFPCSSDHV